MNTNISGTKLIVMLAILFIISGCTKAAPMDDETSEQQKAVKRVKVEKAVLSEWGTASKVNATLLPSVRVDVLAEVSGKLTQEYVEEGDWVEQNQRMFLLDDQEYRFMLERAQIAKAMAELQLEEKKKDLRSSSDIDTEKLIQVSKLQVREAEIAYEEAKSKVAKSTITAPVSGILTNVNVTIGQSLTAGQAVASIEQWHPIHAEVNLTEKDWLAIQGLTEMTLELPLLEQRVKGKILFSTASQNETGGFRLKLRIDNEDYSIRPGMSVNLILSEDEITQSVTVPISALLQDDEGSFVFTVKEGKARKQLVQVGRRTNEVIEILDGLQPGEQVIVAGKSMLQSNDSVEIVQ